jgi:hypothetical protein
VVPKSVSVEDYISSLSDAKALLKLSFLGSHLADILRFNYKFEVRQLIFVILSAKMTYNCNFAHALLI